MSCNVYNDLVSLGLTSDKTAQLFAEQTRDCSSVKVWRDRSSGVIFIKDFYVGDEAYNHDGPEQHSSNLMKRTSFEDAKDCARRADNFKAMYHGKRVCELGFGSGEFMEVVAPFCESISGVELNAEQLARLSKKGFIVAKDLSEFDERIFDTIFMFHAFEHFPDPLFKLNQVRRGLKPGGRVVIEVPHAKDFLLRDEIACEAFKSHTLWSQHLILHTRHSLHVMLDTCGFNNIVIEGVQRYPLSNHVQWLAMGKPGGHISNISSIDSTVLTDAYQSTLSKIDATDTIIAVATIR